MATLDTGNIGSNTEDLAENLIGDRSNAEAVMWYGIASFVLSFGSMFTFAGMSGNQWVPMGSAWWASNVKWFLPVAMCWLLLSFIDTKFVREVFRDLVAASLLGPFYEHWSAIVTFVK